MSKYCPQSGKLCFSSREQATKVVRTMMAKHKGIPSVYFCNVCQSYHLTHYDYTQSKAIRQVQKTGKTFKKLKKMHIYIDTNTPNTMVKVDIPNPEEGSQLRMGFVNATSPQAVLLTYNQAQELVEALKIQIAKIR